VPLKSIFKWHLNLSGVGATGPKSFGLVWGSVKWPPGAGLHSSNKTGWMSALALLGWWHHKYRQAYHHHHHHIIYKPLLLGSPYGIGQTIIFSSCGFFFFYLSFFSSPNLSRRRLDVCHTKTTHGVVLVQIKDAGLKLAARASLQIQDAKNRQKFAIWTPSHNFVGLYLCNYGMYRQLEKCLAAISPPHVPKIWWTSTH